MRKFVKEQILDLIIDMHNVHELLTIYINSKNDQMTTEHLSVCYDAARSIVESIENSKDDQKVVEIIENFEVYCDLLNQISEDLSNIDEAMKKNSIAEDILSNIEYIIQNEIKTKYEILFLPYKASMWDSMESIWVASKSDVDCKCFVMPIPYFDFIQNGDVGQMHNEADLFPSEIPITHLNEYDISKRLPDVIYFHNPYDNCNKVTSVHPDFYSSKLKLYTSMLVYVPYYVSDFDSNDIESLEDFILMPGVRNANKVIVMTEKHKQIFSNYIDTNKILALGSPKFDKVIQYTENPPEIPEDWKNIIRNKKVFLYNTHLLTIVKQGETGIKKLKYVFDTFKENQDAVLLWRPHPLSKEATQAMNIRLIEQYNELVNYYKVNNIGIFDDSADFHRSMAISDAYYGDMSSLVLLYGISGKPVMIQDIDTTSRRNSPWIITSLLDKNILWFLNVTNGSLYKFDITNSKTEFVQKSQDGENVYISLVKWKDNLFFTPISGSTIVAFDMKQNKIDNYSLDNYDIQKGNQERIYGSILYNKKIFLISAKYPIIKCFNIEEKTIDFTIDLSEEINQYVTNKNDIYFCHCWDIVGNTFIIASANSNIILEFNMENYEYIIRRVGNSETTYQGICFDGEYYWLCTRGSKGKIIRWNKNTGETMIIEDYPKDFIRTSAYDFHSIMYINNYVWCIPYNSNKLIKIDTKSLELQTMSFDNEGVIEYDSNKQQFYFAIRKDNLIITQRYADNKIVILDTLTNELKEFVSELPDNEFITYCSNDKESYLSFIIQENLNFNIDSYINKVKDSNCNKRQSYNFTAISNNSDGTCGKEVHENVMKNVRL